MTILLAPGGNLAMVRTAIEGGADAVYCGVRGWSRYPFSGLADEEIRQALAMTHSQGKGFHLAMNTIPRMGEIDLFLDKIARYSDWGIDGLIVNDLGVLDLLHRRFPHLPLCASVGCGAVNVEDVLLLEDAGARTVVLPWIVTPEDVRRIRARSRVGLELFVYGLREYIHLGKCYMPGYVQRTAVADRVNGKRQVLGSAKQGGVCYRICKADCAVAGIHGEHTTRLPYQSFFIFQDLPLFVGAGVDILKIQGRDLDPASVGLLVRFYRHLLDAGDALCAQGANCETELLAWVQGLQAIGQYGQLHELGAGDWTTASPPGSPYVST